MGKFIARMLFYLVALVVVGWTGYRTWHIMSLVTPDSQVVPWLGLAVFDGGLVVWTLYYLKAAEGSPQRATALVGSLIDMVFVFLASGADVWLGGQRLATVPEEYGTYTLWLVVIATAANVFLLWLAHVTDPAARQEMRLRSAQDQIIDKAYDILRHKVDVLAVDLADRMSGVMMAQIVAGLNIDTPARLPVSASTGSGLGEREGAHLAPVSVPIEPGENGLNPTRGSPGRGTSRGGPK